MEVEGEEEKVMLAFMWCLLYLPGTVINVLHIIFKFILTMIQCGKTILPMKHLRHRKVK